MKFTKLFAAVMGLMALMTACQEPETPELGNGKEIAVSAQMYNFTKATDTAFEEGDQIGLHIVTDRTYLNNAKYTYTNGALVAAQTNYWYDDETVTADVLAYYPYAADATYKAEGYNFAVKVDQSVEGAYAASDLLVAATTSKPTE
ncbi:MAG: fimbrillin family protein, partial [Tidjanibacter sp.]|nr:fimbrillin family protein [Tidjanibacter sp.]